MIEVKKNVIERVTVIYEATQDNHKEAVEFLMKNGYKPVVWGPDRKYGIYDVSKQKVIGERRMDKANRKKENTISDKSGIYSSFNKRFGHDK